MMIDNGKFLDPNILHPIDKIFFMVDIETILETPKETRKILGDYYDPIRRISRLIDSNNTDICREVHLC